MANPRPNQSGLRPFRKGQSGNPSGRPKRPDVEALDGLIDRSKSLEKIARTWLDRAIGDIERGIEPDFQWFKLLIEHRNGGPPKNQDDVSTEAEKVQDDIRSIREFVDDIKSTAEGPGPGSDVGGRPRGGKRLRGT